MGTDNYPLSFHMAINHLSYPLKGFFAQPFGSEVNLVNMGKHRSARPSLLPSRLVSQHVKSCHTKEGKCGLCFWQKKKASG